MVRARHRSYGRARRIHSGRGGAGTPRGLDDLSGTGDIYIELGNGDYDAAQRHRRRFEDDMRLLDDLGWDPEEPGEEFELSAPGDQFARALTSLNRNARATLHGHIVEPSEERALAARSLIAQSAYSDVLAKLVGAQTPEPSDLDLDS